MREGTYRGPQGSPPSRAYVPSSRCTVIPPDAFVDNACASSHPELTVAGVSVLRDSSSSGPFRRDVSADVFRRGRRTRVTERRRKVMTSGGLGSIANEKCLSSPPSQKG